MSKQSVKAPGPLVKYTLCWRGSTQTITWNYLPSQMAITTRPNPDLSHHLLPLRDYVRRAKKIQHFSRPCPSYFWTSCTDSPYSGPYTIFEFLEKKKRFPIFHDSFPFSLTWDSMGAKFLNATPSSNCFSVSQLLTFLLNGIHTHTFLDFFNLEFSTFKAFFWKFGIHHYTI